MLNSGKKYSELQKLYRQSIHKCELCLSSDFQIFQQNGRIGAPGEYGRLKITICKRCGFKMQNPRFPDDFYETYYQHLYREVAFGSLSPSDVYISQQKVRGQNVGAWYESHFGSIGTMLDHGCASGGTMLGWLEKGWTCKGLDPHKPSVEAGIKMGLDIEIGTGESLPFDDSSFDLVLSLGSLEHSYNLKKSLAEIHRTLRANGHLVIRWRSNVIFGSPLEYYNHNHYRFFTPQTLELALKIFGFNVIQTTDEKLEGWDSYSYLIASKIDINDIPSANDMISKGAGDNFDLELQKLDEARINYYARCQSQVASRKKLPVVLPKNFNAESLRKHFGDTQIGFLGGDADMVLERILLEAERYIEEYKNGRVI